jgi:hypothetical protein
MPRHKKTKPNKFQKTVTKKVEESEKSKAEDFILCDSILQKHPLEDFQEPIPFLEEDNKTLLKIIEFCQVHQKASSNLISSSINLPLPADDFEFVLYSMHSDLYELRSLDFISFWTRIIHNKKLQLFLNTFIQNIEKPLMIINFDEIRWKKRHKIEEQNLSSKEERKGLEFKIKKYMSSILKSVFFIYERMGNRIEFINEKKFTISSDVNYLFHSLF